MRDISSYVYIGISLLASAMCEISGLTKIDVQPIPWLN